MLPSTYKAMRTGRAQRRHDRERMRQKRVSYHKARYYPADYKAARFDRRCHDGCLVTPCSCWQCGNPRRYMGEKSMQERSAEGLFRCLGLV